MKIKLKDAFDLQIGRTPARSNAANWNGQYKWISITDLGTAGKYISTTKEKITDKGIDESGIKIVPKGTVVMSFKLSIGKTAITTEDMYTNEAIVAFNVRESIQVDSSYLYYLCCGNDWGEGTNKAVMGLTLNKATLSEKEIELPEIMIQREVAKKLDKLDKIIIQRKKQLQKLDELIQARFVEMFGDINVNPLGWDTYNLDECFEIASSKRILKSEWKTEGIPFLRVRDVVQLVTTGKIDNDFFVSEEFYATLKDSDGIPKQGDVLVSATSTLGKCYIVKSGERFYFKDADVLRFRSKKNINPVFFVEQMKTQYIEKQIARTLGVTTVAHFTIKAAKTINMRLPDIDLQNQFADFVNQVNKSKVEIQQALEKTQLLFDSLMQQYFG